MNNQREDVDVDADADAGTIVAVEAILGQSGAVLAVAEILENEVEVNSKLAEDLEVEAVLSEAVMMMEGEVRHKVGVAIEVFILEPVVVHLDVALPKYIPFHDSAPIHKMSSSRGSRG